MFLQTFPPGGEDRSLTLGILYLWCNNFPSVLDLFLFPPLLLDLYALPTVLRGSGLGFRMLRRGTLW